MKLKDILHQLNVSCDGQIDHNTHIETISCDSREVMSRGIFVAIQGVTTNGELYIGKAIEQGAAVIVKTSVGREYSQGCIPESIGIIVVSDTKKFLERLLSVFYQSPDQSVRLIGVTGTNGKTTFTYLMESILNAAGKSCGVIGTINYRIAGKIIPSKNTTPGIVDNLRYLAQLKQMDIPYCVMETSSHALEQGRLDGIRIVGGVFSNLTQDHLDYHHSMESYFRAKAKLFEGLSAQAYAVINCDDVYGQRLVTMTKARVITYAIDQQADVQAIRINYGLSETSFDLVYPGGVVKVKTRFIGKHNIYNILSAVGAALGEGVAIEDIICGISQLSHVPGRLEPVDAGQSFYVFIDYAHTEDGLINVINSIRRVSDKRIIVVFGCGGNRDKTKRPLMARAVSQLADYAIITSDNPRQEDPVSIIQDITAGMTHQHYEVCEDRKEAIGKAIAIAKEGETVLLAGKGHEDYQILKDKTIEFNERAIVLEYLKQCLPLKK